MLTTSQKERYFQAIILPDVSEEGQIKLSEAKVLVVGVGAMGCIASSYLTAAGVGNIGLIDFDTIDIDDLQHQVLYETSFLNRPKVRSAQVKLQKMNPHITINGYFEALDAHNITKIIEPYDFILNTTNNFFTTSIINQACVSMNKPFNTAGYYQYQGQIMTYVPGSACFACVFDTLIPQELRKKFQGGVLGFSTGILGSIQAGEVIKYFLYKSKPDIHNVLLTDCLVLFDGRVLSFEKKHLHKNPHCPICAKNP